MRPYETVRDVRFAADDVSIRWYADGVLNVCANCVDRHAAVDGDRRAIVWEGDEPGDSETLTYGELLLRVCRFANVLKGMGARKGDRRHDLHGR